MFANRFHSNEPSVTHSLALQESRRAFLYGLGSSLGSVALSAILQAEDSARTTVGPLAVKSPMVPAKAKNVIMLFMEGGPGHMDTFDPKPTLSGLQNDWRWMLGVEAFPAFFYTLFCFLIPESPRWLIGHANDRETGLKVLGMISPDQSVSDLE
jgi:hypothetical protein